MQHALLGKDSLRLGTMLGLLSFLTRLPPSGGLLTCVVFQGALLQYTESFSMHSPFSSLRTSPSLSICATWPKSFCRHRTLTTRLYASCLSIPIPQSISLPPPRRGKHASPSLRKRTRRGYAESRHGGIQSWPVRSLVASRYHLRTHRVVRLLHSSYSSGKFLYANFPAPET